MKAHVADPDRWSRYEAETECRMRQALGDDLYEWLEKMTEESNLESNQH